jgi:alpha-glucosidase
MRWDNSRYGGFSTASPWLPQDKAHRNVASLRADERSILHLWRRLIALRKEQPALINGEWEPLRSRNDILAFRRRLPNTTVLALLNLKRDPRQWVESVRGKLLLSTYLDREDDLTIDAPPLLRGEEGLLIRES